MGIWNSTIISGSSTALMLNSTRNMTISNSYILSSTGGIGVNLTDSGGILIFNSTILASPTSIIFGVGSGNNTILNTTFNRSGINFTTGVNNVTVSWYLNFTVDAINGSPISGASVNATNASGAQALFNGTTDASGDINAVNEFIELKANGSFAYNTLTPTLNYTPYNNYTFFANKTTFNTNSTNATINQSQTVALTLSSVPPRINWVNSSNVTPNIIYNNSVGSLCQANVTTSIGTLFVNFTIIAPDSTVLVNGVNSTNTSLTDIYNSTNFTIRYVGTYTCVVRAWDGTNNVTNSTTFAVLSNPPHINWVNASNVTPNLIFNNTVGTICQSNVTDLDGDQKFVNFTIIAPDATVLVNEVNSSNVSLSDIYNSTNFTISQIGLYTCVVRAFDGNANSNTTNSTTFQVLNNKPVINQMNLSVSNASIEASNSSSIRPMANVTDPDGFATIRVVNFSIYLPVGAAKYVEALSTVNDSASIFNGTNFTPNVLGLGVEVVRAWDGTDNVSDSRTFRVADTINATIAFHNSSNATPVRGTILLNTSAFDSFNLSTSNITIDGGAPVNACTVVATDNYNLTCSYSWDTTALADGFHTVTAMANDTSNNTGIAARVYNVDNTAPLVNVSSPANGSTVGQTWSILAQANDSTGVLNVSFRVERNGANFTPWQNLTRIAGDIFSGYWRYSYDSSALADGTYNISFNATDFGQENSSVYVTVIRDTSVPPGGGGDEPHHPPPGCGEPGGSVCPPKCGEPGGVCPPPPPPPCDPSIETCGGENPETPAPGEPGSSGGNTITVCITSADCPGDSECDGSQCRQLNGTCGFGFNHQWVPYECCGDSACGSNEFCDSALHACVVEFKPPDIPPGNKPGQPQCIETCGNGGGSGVCCSGYCENSVCVLKPPAAAIPTEIAFFGGVVELKSACAGLGIGLDEFSCNLVWLPLPIVSALAGIVAARTRGRLFGAALLLLPLFVGIVTFVSAGIALALAELVISIALAPRRP
jgi:hypothetical protein